MPKRTLTEEEKKEFLEFFRNKLHIDEKNSKNYLKNYEKCVELKECFVLAGIENPTKDEAVLICSLTTVKNMDQRKFLGKAIGDSILTTSNQLKEAISYVKKNDVSSINIDDFKTACGYGISVTLDEIQKHIGNFIEKNKVEFETQRYLTKIGKVFGQLKKDPQLKWADQSQVSEELTKQLHELWGPKTEADEEMEKSAKKKKAKDKKAEKVKKKAVEKNKEAEKPKLNFSFDSRPVDGSTNPPELIEKHKNDTGGKVLTRFPPEPNGFLHIGHAKAMNLSFGYAQHTKGETYLRYDDTNPTKEKQSYVDSILDIVQWLGFKAWKITYSSDYFDEMYAVAISMIKKGLAYVDFQDKDTISKERFACMPSKYRDTSPEENLKHFEDMTKGKYEEGKAVLRVKADYKHDNPNMRDFVAYRIMYSSHHRTGDKWCVYPTYDFTHCLVDSFENITHSLCTLEFEIRRESYFWLLKVNDLWRPHVWEFSRLNVSTSLLSKRKINLLVEKNLVRDFDDPRLLTLAGLRRRGYTPEAILSFCNEIGISRTENIISVRRLQQSLRKDLDVRCNRVFVVIRPIQVRLTNYPKDKVEFFEGKNHPMDASRGKRKLPFSSILYIDERDFKLEDEKDFFGLAPGKAVRLRFGPNIQCNQVHKDKDGNIEYLECELIDEKLKPKGKIHWLAQPKPNQDPERAEVRIYDNLFKTGTVAELDEYLPPKEEADLLQDINPNSEKIYPNALIDPEFSNPENRNVYAKFQFERVGFFCVDKDSTENRLVFNFTVGLKEKWLEKK